MEYEQKTDCPKCNVDSFRQSRKKNAEWFEARRVTFDTGTEDDYLALLADEPEEIIPPRGTLREKFTTKPRRTEGSGREFVVHYECYCSSCMFSFNVTETKELCPNVPSVA